VEIWGEDDDELLERVPASLFRQAPELCSQERLLLKLCHRDGKSVAEAARMLGMSRFQAHGRLKRLYRRTRRALEAAGLAEALRTYLRS
jgi:DNA-directed RNA polymerase specialized sigma24 family protein